MMSANYLLKIDKNEEEVAVRLVGIIDEKECEAVLNTEDAARKVSTAGSIQIDTINPYGKRFVLVVRVKSSIFGNDVPIVFISPVINQVSYIQGNRELRCHEGEMTHYYRFIPLEDKTKG